MAAKKNGRGPNQILKELRSLAEAAGVATAPPPVDGAPAAGAPEPSGMTQKLEAIKGMFNELRSYYEDDALDGMIQQADKMAKGGTEEAMDEFMKECDQIASELADAGEKNQKIGALSDKFSGVVGEMKTIYNGRALSDREGGDDSDQDATAVDDFPQGDHPEHEKFGADAHADKGDEEGGEDEEPKGEKKPKSDDDEDAGEEKPKKKPEPKAEAAGNEEDDDSDEGEEDAPEKETPMNQPQPGAAPMGGSGPREIPLGSKLPPAGAQASDIVKPTKGGPGDTQVPAVQVTIMRENRERTRAMRESAWGPRPRR